MPLFTTEYDPLKSIVYLKIKETLSPISPQISTQSVSLFHPTNESFRHTLVTFCFLPLDFPMQNVIATDEKF